MKTAKVLGIVFALHTVFFIFVFVQPGCGTLDLGEAPEPEVRPTATGHRTALVAPTRPEGDIGTVSGGTDTIGALESTLNDPSFSFMVDDDLDFDPSLDGLGLEEDNYTTYVVQRGDNAWNIASKFDVPVNTLLDLNSLGRDSILRVGQELKIPASPEAATVTARPSEPSVDRDDLQTYTVRSGDTLSGIASRTGTSVATIRSLNNLTSDLIRVGQELRLPSDARVSDARRSDPAPAARTPAAPARTSPGEGQTTHRVVAGENPSSIAAMYGMTTQELLTLNAITDPRRLRVGQELIVNQTGTTRTERAPTAERSPQPAERETTAPRPTTRPTTTEQERATAPAIRPAPAPIRPPAEITSLDDLDDDSIPVVEITPDN